MRDGCGWSGGRWCGSAACGGWLTRRPPGSCGDDLCELLLGFLEVLLDTEAHLKNLLTIDIRVLDKAMGTGSVGRGETILEELRRQTAMLPRAAGAGWGRRERRHRCAGGGGGGGVGGDRG